MAQAVVSFAAKWIAHLMIQEANLLYGVRDQVEGLVRELRRMQCFLKDADAKQVENEINRNLVAEIREIAYDAEDVIATFIVELEPRRRRGFRNFITRSTRIFNELIARRKIGSEIRRIKSKITELTATFPTYGLIAMAPEREGPSSALQRQLRQTYSHVDDEDFTGFEQDIETLVDQLTREEAKHRKVVSICAMGGSGKTTLARKVYIHEDVVLHFEAFAWVSISQQWERKDVLQRILTKLIPEVKDDVGRMIEDDLVKLLFEIQQQKKCLVVFDDVWSPDAWECFSPAFPRGNPKGSKIFVTTRNMSVVKSMDPSGFILKLKPLSPDESWKLFEKKAFSKTNTTEFKVDTMMEKLGREMVEQCQGLPLSIVVLGGLLGTNLTLSHWQKVQQNFHSYPKRGDYIRRGGGGGHGRIFDVFALSYQDLPYQLKACFLYLGNYPDNFDIDAERLYQLWMAEGFIENGGEETMMDVAKHYLGELAQRCMVQVELQREEEYSQIRESRGFRCCRLHDLMRELCLSKAKEENFHQVITYGHINQQDHPSSSSMVTSIGGNTCSKIHRLIMNLDKKNSNFRLFEQEESARHIRTILFFRGDDCDYPFGEQLTRFSKESKFLRVINFDVNSFDKTERTNELPKEIGNLILLRHLGLNRTAFTKLPSSIGNLRHLQTLDLRVSYHGEISVPNVLWKMEGLVHLYLPLFGCFCTKGKLRVDGLKKLETLENLDSDKVNVRDLFTLPNLQRLENVCVKGNLEDLTMVNNYIVDSKHRLQHTSVTIENCDLCSEDGFSLLRQLLGCVCLVKLDIDGVIGQFPQYEHQLLCPSLTDLWLCGSELEEDPMATLEKLPNLRILYLYTNAFAGRKMVCSAYGFPHLKSLTLSCLEIEDWRVDDGAMPELSSLFITSCMRLRMLPNGLRLISTLQELMISRMPGAFNDRLRVVHGQEGEDFHKISHIPSIRIDEGKAIPFSR